MNVPPTIGMVLSGSGNPAQTIELLQTVLSVEDLHDLIEVTLIDAHNNRVIDKINASRRRRD